MPQRRVDGTQRAVGRSDGKWRWGGRGPGARCVAGSTAFGVVMSAPPAFCRIEEPSGALCVRGTSLIREAPICVVGRSSVLVSLCAEALLSVSRPRLLEHRTKLEL